MRYQYTDVCALCAVCELSEWNDYGTLSNGLSYVRIVANISYAIRLFNETRNKQIDGEEGGGRAKNSWRTKPREKNIYIENENEMADQTYKMCVTSENSDVKARTEHEQIFTGRSIGSIVVGWLYAQTHTYTQRTHVRPSCEPMHPPSGNKETENSQKLTNRIRFESSDLHCARIVYDFVSALWDIIANGNQTHSVNSTSMLSNNKNHHHHQQRDNIKKRHKNNHIIPNNREKFPRQPFSL